MPNRRNPDQEWEETRLDPIRGPKGDTAFLRDNYRLMGGPGGIFRTPRSRFTDKQIRDGATKAGFEVSITQEGLWAKVVVLRKIPQGPAALKKQTEYTGAGKKYPVEPPKPPKPVKLKPAAHFKKWEEDQKKKVDIFS